MRATRARILAAMVLSIAAPATPVEGQTNAEAVTRVVDALRAYGVEFADVVKQAIFAQSGTFPIATSATGFTIVFDRQLALPKRTSQQFGPLFGDRALGGGKGTFSLAFHHQAIRWKHIDGLRLREGDLLGQLSDTFPIPLRVRLDYRTEHLTASASAGLNDDLEIGVAVPLVRASVDGEGLERVASSASGIGDIAARAKYTVWRRLSAHPGQHVAVAALAEVRFPTGDQANLLGTGFRRTSVTGLVSAEQARVSEFVNVGYTWGGRGVIDPSTLDRDFPLVFEPSEELRISGGAHARAGKRVTVGGEILARRLFNSARLFQSTDVQILPKYFVDVQLLHGVAGVKVNVAREVLLSAHVLVPLSEQGLNPGALAVFGLQITRGAGGR